MKLDFFLHLENPKLLKVYDVSPLSEYLPLDIYSYTLEIKGSKLPNGGLSKSLDIISYLKTQRIQNEIYSITSNTLGLGVNKNIPDGVYHFYYHINNIIHSHRTFLIYQNVKFEVEKLLKESQYKVEIDNESMKYIKDDISVKYDIEKVRYAKTLLDTLEMYSQIPDEIEVNDVLDKLNRLLGILKQ